MIIVLQSRALPWAGLWWRGLQGAVPGVLSGWRYSCRVIAVRQLEAVASLGTASVLGWGGGEASCQGLRCLRLRSELW